MEHMSFSQVIQAILFLSSLGLLIYSCIWWIKRKDLWFIIVPIFFLLFHTVVYSAVTSYVLHSGMRIEYLINGSWGAVLRLHTVVTIGTCLYVLDRIIDVIVINKISNKVENPCLQQRTQSG